MQLLKSLVTIACAAGALAATTLTGQYSCATSGDYELCNDQWGSGNGVGSQNSTLVSTSGTSISWTTTYTWANNENDVKSFANVEQTSAQGMTLADITSAPTSWTWEYTSSSSGLRADVAYDIWFGTSTGDPGSSTSTYEIMIWLSGEGGIQPVGSQADSDVTVAGYSWDIWSGENTNWETISFVTTSGNINDFNNIDLNDFFTYLIDNEGVSSSLILQAIQAGTEAFTGTATLNVESFSVTVNT